MAEKKKQHFVPQFYLRNFSADEDKIFISSYLFASERRFEAVPIKGQNYDDYFYGKDGVIENALAGIEGAASQTIASVLTDDTLPGRESDGFIALLIFALFQSSRTPSAAQEVNEHLDKFAKELARDLPELQSSVDEVRFEYTNAPSLALKIAAQNYPFLLDLKWKLLLNRSKRLYITSDHPVVLYNQFLEKKETYGSNIGFVAKGLQVFFPLGPRHLLMMYDSDVYRVGGRKHFDQTIEVQESDVRALNSMQAADCDELLFYSQVTDSTHIDEAVVDGRHFHLTDKVAIARHSAMSDGEGDLLHSSRPELRMGLILPSVAVRPAAAGHPLEKRVVHLRNPEFVGLCEEFRSKVEAGGYASSDFHVFMKDRLRRQPPLFKAWS